MLDLMQLINVKILAATGVILGSMLADAAIQSPLTSWESVGLKTALIAAIIYLVRDNASQRAMSAADGVKREERLAAVIESNTRAKEANTQALNDLRAETAIQTSWYKTVAQTLINREIKPQLPKET